MPETVFLTDAASFPVAAEAWAKGKGLLTVAGAPFTPSLTATQITHNAQPVSLLLDKALYTKAVISNFVASPSIIEQGSSVSVNLTWTITGPANGQTMNGTPIAASDRARSYTGVTTSTTYTLVASDSVAPGGAQSVTAAVTVTVLPRRYWGVSNNAVLSSSEIVALGNSELSGDRGKTFTVDGGTSPGKYVYYAYPASLGAQTNYEIFGFQETPTVTTVSVTTAAGAVMNYTVLRSENKLLGTVSVTVT